MTLFPETTQADAASSDLLASAAPFDLGAPKARRNVDVASQAPVSVRRLVVRFALAGLPVLAAAIVVTAIASVRIGTKLGIDDAKRVSYASALLVEEQALEEGLLEGDPDAIARMDDFVRKYILRSSLIKVKIHTGDGTIIYSNEPLLIGQSFPMGDDEREVLSGELDVEAEISDLSKEENTLETEERLLEVYRGIRTPETQTAVLFETYFRYDDVRDVGRDLWRQFAPIAVGALLILALVQIPFAISLARRLRAGQLQRERLLQHAIDSSDAERRRIASDLHDGAVQDLIGISYTIEAKADTAPEPLDDTLHEIAGSTRTVIRSLRSILNSIYPVEVPPEGWDHGLADLVQALESSGVEVTLDIDDVDLAPMDGLLFLRVTREALRNVATHADASQVLVRLEQQRLGRLVLQVNDDGRGFTAANADSSRSEGHLGLQLLYDLANDVGADLTIDSTPGVGTNLRLELMGQR